MAGAFKPWAMRPGGRCNRAKEGIMKRLEAPVMLALIVICAGLTSYSLALVGEPQTYWLWCSVLALCN